MSFNKEHAKHALRTFNFEDLFIDDLGWDLACRIQPLQEKVDEGEFIFTPIAEKKDLVVFLCEVPNEFPPHALRKKLDSRIAKIYREHFIIFTDQRRTRQLWQWVWREPGRPLVSRTHEYRPEQPGESLIQKLETIAFTLEQEETLNIVEVSGRLRAAFNVEHATRRFYDYFKKERTAFENFISGIENIETKREYVSIMLNRLMFIYFIQRKGFLDEDTEYLRNRMAITKDRYGDNQFYSFYRYFLLRLFHEVLGSLERNPEIEELIGDVPYLNGGIFELHQIERDNPDIQIPDEAFKRILDFFDQYQWHLDDRPLRADNEINPDVLGYIFEKYINQKQMGAYYTKEDITEYISKNTIIPYLFDAAQKIYPKSFKGNDSFWILLEADPRRYVYEAVQKGVDLPLPEEIVVGIEDVSKRGKWNTRTPEEYALPTEIWRETIARRKRYQEVRDKLKNGEVTEISDFITCNLDIQQFAQDVIETCDKPETLRAFWKAIRNVTILDPTCGSGAFLFAALNILHPLYEACLDRMQTFIDEYPQEAPAHALRDFKDTLANVSRHPNEGYFILKSIIVDNLYGVDIMAEAVEIAKLRLFLKLAAQVEPDGNKENWGIEPLPDIDFNIRPGNTLVGFATRDDVVKAFKGTADPLDPGYGEQKKMGLAKDAVQLKMLSAEDSAALKQIEERAGDIDRLFNRFRYLQITYDMSSDNEDFVNTKAELNRRLNELGSELDKTLASQYGITERDQKGFSKWKDNYKPFHWFINFFGIIKTGGFNVIIGNPPFVEYRNIEKQYSVKDYSTQDCGNLYAYVCERSFKLLNSNCYLGMIFPISSISSTRASSFQLLTRNFRSWISTYSNRPGKLFTGVEQRINISIQKKEEPKNGEYYSSPYKHWYGEERDHLFHLLSYQKCYFDKQHLSIGKISGYIHFSIINKIYQAGQSIKATQLGNEPVYFHDAPTYWIRAMAFDPNLAIEKPSTHYKEIRVSSPQIQKTITSILNSSLFYIFYKTFSNCRDFLIREVKSFPFPNNLPDFYKRISKNFDDLENNYVSNRAVKSRKYPSGEISYYEYYPAQAKIDIDKIDKALADEYEISANELDYIINNDIKYRMGDELFGDENGKNHG